MPALVGWHRKGRCLSMEPAQTYTLRQAAAFLGVSERTVRRAVKAGTLSADLSKPPGGRQTCYTITRESLDKLLASGYASAALPKVLLTDQVMAVAAQVALLTDQIRLALPPPSPRRRWWWWPIVSLGLVIAAMVAMVGMTEACRWYSALRWPR